MVPDIGEQFAAAWSSRSPTQFASLFTEACVYEDIPLAVVARGRGEVATHFASWLTSSSDIHMEFLGQLVEGDRVAVEWLYTGTHDGTFEGLQPTGRRFKFRGASVLQVRGAQISACADYWDKAYLLELLR